MWLSSPFFYNKVTRMQIMITLLEIGTDSRLSVQQLDDNPVAGRKGSLELRRYYKLYWEIAKM